MVIATHANQLTRQHVDALLAIEDLDAAADWPRHNSAEVVPRNLDAKFLFEPSSYQLLTKDPHFLSLHLPISVRHIVMQKFQQAGV
jgi:hypothetical protein